MCSLSQNINRWFAQPCLIFTKIPSITPENQKTYFNCFFLVRLHFCNSAWYNQLAFLKTPFCLCLGVMAYDCVERFGSPGFESGMSLSRLHCNIRQVTLLVQYLHPGVSTWVPGIWDELSIYVNEKSISAVIKQLLYAHPGVENDMNCTGIARG